MKIQATKEALVQAIAKATMMFHSPKLMVATQAVINVKQIKATKTATSVPTAGICTCECPVSFELIGLPVPVSDQVEKWEQEDPNHVDEVPVEANHFNGHKIVGVKDVAIGLND